MIGIKTITKSQRLNRSACPSCHTKVYNIQINKYFQLLFISLFNISRKEYLQCKPCNKTLSETTIKKQQILEQTQKTKADGTVVLKHTHQTLKGSSSTTYYDHSKYIPEIENKELIGQTIIAIMCLMSRLDERISINENESYLFIESKFQEHQKSLDKTFIKIKTANLELAKKEVEKLFTEAHEKLGTNSINFILRQCLSLTKNQFILHHEIDAFLKVLLDIFEIGNLRHESYISDLRF